MFANTFIRLKRANNLLAKQYANVVADHFIIIIICYVIVTLIFCSGLIQLRFDAESAETMLEVSDRESARDELKLRDTFKYNADRFFLHKIYDIGAFFDIMCLYKSPNRSKLDSYADLMRADYNLINENYLNEFNDLFDTIFRFQIESDEEKDTMRVEHAKVKRSSFINYSSICPGRLNKCAIEGGVILVPKTQQKLLNYQIDYYAKDNRTAYSDAELIDGFSFNFLFGLYRRDKLAELLPQKPLGDRYIAQHVSSVRIRFELHRNTPEAERLSKKYLNSLLDYLEKIVPEKNYSYLNLSYFASTSHKREIEKYSQIDLNNLLLSLATFWLLMFALFNVSSSSLDNNTNTNINNNSSSATKRRIVHLTRKYLINRAGLLPLAILVQFMFTIVSTIGILSYLNVTISPIIAQPVLLLMCKFLYFSLSFLLLIIIFI